MCRRAALDGASGATRTFDKHKGHLLLAGGEVAALEGLLPLQARAQLVAGLLLLLACTDTARSVSFVKITFGAAASHMHKFHVMDKAIAQHWGLV